MEQSIDKIIQLLRELAVQLGVTTQEVYQVLTERAFVDGVVNTVFSAVIAVSGFVVGLKLLISVWRRHESFINEYGRSEWTDGTVARAVVGGACTVAGLLATGCIPGYVIQLITPQATALQEIMRLLK